MQLAPLPFRKKQKKKQKEMQQLLTDHLAVQPVKTIVFAGAFWLHIAVAVSQ
jgi:hypothetical protein